MTTPNLELPTLEEIAPWAKPQLVLRAKAKAKIYLRDLSKLNTCDLLECLYAFKLLTQHQSHSARLEYQVQRRLDPSLRSITILSQMHGLLGYRQKDD